MDEYFLINVFVCHLAFTDPDPFVFCNIKIPLVENTPNFHNLLLSVRIPILIIS